jgi:phage FluMu protein Com
VLIYEGVLLPAMRCKYCETPLLAVEGRAWLQFKQRKEMARGYR